MIKKIDPRQTKSSIGKQWQVKELDHLQITEIPDTNQLHTLNRTILALNYLKEFNQVNSIINMMLLELSKTTSWISNRCKNSICNSSSNSTQGCNIKEESYLQAEDKCLVDLKWWATQSSVKEACNKEMKRLTKWRGKSLGEKWFLVRNSNISQIRWTILSKCKKKISKINSETLKLQIISLKTRTPSWRPNSSKSNRNSMPETKNLRSLRFACSRHLLLQTPMVKAKF